MRNPLVILVAPRRMFLPAGRFLTPRKLHPKAQMLNEFSHGDRPMTNTSFLLCSRAAATCAALVLLTAFGCKKTVDDATLTTNVHNALAPDNPSSQHPIQDTVQAGVVTLTGNVTDDTASSVAAEDAAKVDGVKEVVN